MTTTEEFAPPAVKRFRLLSNVGTHLAETEGFAGKGGTVWLRFDAVAVEEVKPEPPTPPEPEPGAYLLDGSFVMRVPGDKTVRWLNWRPDIYARYSWDDWADIAKPGSTVIALWVPLPEGLAFPGEACATRFPDGGWGIGEGVSTNVWPQVPLGAENGCSKRAHDGGTGGFWECSVHLGGWHIALAFGTSSVGAVWQLPNGGRS